MKCVWSLLALLAIGVHAAEFETIQKNITAYHPSHWPDYKKVEAQTLRKDSLILASDQTPVDVILRRTQALINHLDVTGEQSALDALKKKNSATLSADQQRVLFAEIAAVRRRVSFSNPLLDFDSLMFLKHDRTARGDEHMVDQYLGLNQRRMAVIPRWNIWRSISIFRWLCF